MSTTLLQSYLDRETDAATARHVGAHLDECHHCDRDARTFQQLRSSLTRHGGPDEAAVGRLHDFAHSLLRGGGDESAEKAPEPGA
ncbi:zf-HC2 domain-containing protein [Streptomyces gobiensis]|uniref:zf-HC2 domain-containing protein n=1 Tax=Streptomyces gobiensis TaxID=2875706 RepID=UPI001E5E8797|nr:zf-HC2 domain-containing protein [Streptomyces gobiensis]